MKQLENEEYAFLSILVGENIENVLGEITFETKGFIMDLTPFFRDDEKVCRFHLLWKKSLTICKRIGRSSSS